MLKTTPSLTPPSFTASTTNQNPKPTNTVSGYRDFQDGETNKYFSYLVHDFDHALNFLDRCRNKGQKIRASFYNGKAIFNNGQ